MLLHLLRHPDVRTGATDVGWLERLAVRGGHVSRQFGDVALVQAAQGATVVVHALNPAYTNTAWQSQVLPMTEAALAITRMAQAGVSVVNTEMAVFELLGQAGTAEFKALSALVR